MAGLTNNYRVSNKDGISDDDELNDGNDGISSLSSGCSKTSSVADGGELLRVNGISNSDDNISLQQLIENELTFKISSSSCCDKSTNNDWFNATDNTTNATTADVNSDKNLILNADVNSDKNLILNADVNSDKNLILNADVNSDKNLILNADVNSDKNLVVNADSVGNSSSDCDSVITNKFRVNIEQSIDDTDCSFLTASSDSSSAITVIECINHQQKLLLSSAASISNKSDDDKLEIVKSNDENHIEHVNNDKSSQLTTADASIELKLDETYDSIEDEFSKSSQSPKSNGSKSDIDEDSITTEISKSENLSIEEIVRNLYGFEFQDPIKKYRDDNKEYRDHTKEYRDHTKEYRDHTKEYRDHTKEYRNRKDNVEGDDHRDDHNKVTKESSCVHSAPLMYSTSRTTTHEPHLIVDSQGRTRPCFGVNLNRPVTKSIYSPDDDELMLQKLSTYSDPFMYDEEKTGPDRFDHILHSIGPPHSCIGMDFDRPVSKSVFSPLIANSSFDVSHIVDVDVDEDDILDIVMTSRENEKKNNNNNNNNNNSDDNNDDAITAKIVADICKNVILLSDAKNGNANTSSASAVSYILEHSLRTNTTRAADSFAADDANTTNTKTSATISTATTITDIADDNTSDTADDAIDNETASVVDSVMMTPSGASNNISFGTVSGGTGALDSDYSLSVASWEERASDYLENGLVDTSNSGAGSLIDENQSIVSAAASSSRKPLQHQLDDDLPSKIDISSVDDDGYSIERTICKIDDDAKDLNGDTNAVEKKSVKKKKSSSEEMMTMTKVKKTKKTKKSEEKENISVNIANGRMKINNKNPENGFENSSFHQITDDTDELSNVCVRDLKLTYCNKTNKGKPDKLVSIEEPVPSSVPIGVLKRCFDDNCSSNENGIRPIIKKTRSLGDLRLAEKMYKHCSSEEYPRISKSGFGKFDQMIKKPILHVRSSDASKAQQQFGQNKVQLEEAICKACNKVVFAMEQIKAERHVWHKNCFRCKTCSKQLTVDIYSSHEGELYCKPHFRDLFKPKVVIDDEESLKIRKPELIIRENEPIVLPPDVVRASDKPDLGLEELSSLNVMSRFQVFENPPTKENNAEKSPIVNVKRSQSILSKLARFQAKGMDVGVSSDIFNSINYEESSSSDEDQNDNVVKSNVAREKPIAFNKMDDVKKTFESGQTARKEERREERRQELQHIRSRLFMGKQGKMKEAYEQAVAESGRGPVKQRDVEVKSDKARSIKERFERGQIAVVDNSDEDQQDSKNKSNVKDEDFNVFEAGISKKSRSLFQQMDANIAKTKSTNAVPAVVNSNNCSHQERRRSKIVTQQTSSGGEIVRSSDPVAEVSIETADVSSKFKFFETYKPPEITRKNFRITPPREDQVMKGESTECDTEVGDVAQSDSIVDEEIELKKSQTTAKMLSFFRQMEEAHDGVSDGGRKPLKKFTPPPVSSSSEEESDDESEEPSEASSNVPDDIVRASDKVEDEFLKQAQTAARAKALKEKFERWEPEKQSSSGHIVNNNVPAEGEQTKSLRAKFELLRAEQPADKPRPKVNRFV